MKTSITSLRLGTLLLAASTLGAAAYAAQPAPAGSGNAPAQEAPHDRRADHMQERMAARWEKRSAELKASLKLTSAQTPAWDAFNAAMKPQAPQDRGSFKREDWAKLTTPERLNQMRTWRQQRDSFAAQRDEATSKFYDTLSAEQKKTFDTRTAQPFFFGDEPDRGPRG